MKPTTHLKLSRRALASLRTGGMLTLRSDDGSVFTVHADTAKTATAPRVDYRQKAYEVSDPDLRAGYLRKAADQDSNPVIPMLSALSTEQLEAVLNAVLELLPADDGDDDSVDAALFA